MLIVQCSCLENWAGFGNSLFMFCFAKAYAKKYNAELQIPKDWIGRKLFKGVDKIEPIKKKLPETSLDEIPNGKSNVNLRGYFQFMDAYNYYSLSEIKELLQFKDEWTEMFPKIKDYYVACHLRRGDYEKFKHIFCTISERSYMQAVSVYGYSPLDIVWVSMEQKMVVKDCPYAFLPDFFTLMNADVLFRANSTFSVWASILGVKNLITYSPNVENKTGINIDVLFELGNHNKTVGSYGGASPQIPAMFIFKP
jgi:hypothetical protein